MKKIIDGVWIILIAVVLGMVSSLVGIAYYARWEQRRKDRFALVRMAMAAENRQAMDLRREVTMSITCPTCGMTSHNPFDVAEGYCGNCHAWTSRCTRCFLAVLDIDGCPARTDLCVVCCIQTSDPCGHVASYLKERPDENLPSGRLD